MLHYNKNSLQAIIMTGLFTALIYLGIFIFRIPIPALVGRPFIHFGNTLAILAVLFLGLRNGALAGVIGLGGFDILNGYALTSWLTMLEITVVAVVVSLLLKAFDYNDSKQNIIIIAIIAGTLKIGTSYCTSIIEALMVGTTFKTAIVASFFSLPATVINSISTAICVPLLYFLLKQIFSSIRRRHN
ncbi:ECF transporter S component [Liquorilactobacillus capillatus]|uniref:Integral membrane protein n=1 Tax=Liquorilactobacillus capillatus DSM 19910 TaxID=1423731 RepID=A0A0R1MDL1_9LACO|nr:ECF transporter S component [Liquorilactobacillus capillatus]KRL02363.1 integral membrane protein [Liquorilactobacillus capillatus DSM 19910]